MGFKNANRLDYQGLAASLDQRGLVDAPRLQVALTTCHQTGQPFPEILVMDDLIGDWELSRVVCELYNLPFVPVDFCEPNDDALEVFDKQFLRANRLVPVGRFGDLITVAMPAIVPAEVLGSLAASLDLHILPMVGTVVTNNRWIADHLEEAVEHIAGPLPTATSVSIPGLPELPSLGDISVNLPDLDELGMTQEGWSNIFDEGNAAVLSGLDDDPEDDAPPQLSLDGIDELDDLGL